MERKRDIWTVKVVIMMKTCISEERVNESLMKLIADDISASGDSKMELYNTVSQEVGDLSGLQTHPSPAMSTSGAEETLLSQPKPSGTFPNHDQEPPSWHAPLLLAISQQQPKSSKKKFLYADTFDGSQKKYPLLKQQLKAKFDADPEDLLTPKKVYDYTLMRTTGSAARMMLSIVEDANKSSSHSMETFWDFLNSKCLDSHIVHRARDRLITNTQGRRSVRDYNADCRKQLLLSGATLDRVYRIALFRRGLNAKLQLLATCEPLTYKDIVGKAVTVLRTGTCVRAVPLH